MNYSYEYEYDQKYCYANSRVLKNKLNILDSECLEEYERKICAVIHTELNDKPPKGEMNFNYLLKLHKRMFSEIYTWAGKIRTVNIYKGNSFCSVQFITEYANSIFDELKVEKYLTECSEDNLPKRLAYYLSEINTIHPFREGNGRAQRLFITILANRIGYDLMFDIISQEEMIEASVAAFNKDYSLMEIIMKKVLLKI